MSAFIAFIEFLVTIGLVVTLISNYLIVNKLWSRRAAREVAESVSISAALLGLFTSLPLLVNFALIDRSAVGVAKSAISIATAVVFVLIGSGLWVPEYRGRRFFRLFLGALRLERRESTDLIKAIVQPRGAHLILDILRQLAVIDRELHEREVALIREFADRWHLPQPELNGEAASADLLQLRQGMVDYLALEPPRDQAAQLLDLLRLFADADSRMHWREDLALDELGGLVRSYLSEEAGGAAPVMHEVLIVPQSKAQFDAVRSLLPGHEEKTVRGGIVFSVGRFFSPRYAEMVCEKYIALGLFTAQVAVTPEPRASPSPAE